MCLPVLAAAALGGVGTAAAAGSAIAGLSSMQLLTLGLAGAAAGMGAAGAYQQAKFQGGMAEYNAKVAETQAQGIERAGEEEAQGVRRKAGAAVGAQRATYSARGLDIYEGTPADTIAQTDIFGEMDAATTRRNARQGAWAARARGRGYQAEADSINPGLSAASTLLTGATSVADRWYRYAG